MFFDSGGDGAQYPLALVAAEFSSDVECANGGCDGSFRMFCGCAIGRADELSGSRRANFDWLAVGVPFAVKQEAYLERGGISGRTACRRGVCDGCAHRRSLDQFAPESGSASTPANRKSYTQESWGLEREAHT